MFIHGDSGGNDSTYICEEHVKTPLFLRRLFANTFDGNLVGCVSLLHSDLRKTSMVGREGETILMATFTSGYFCSIVALRLGRFVPSKSMRYRCFAPVWSQTAARAMRTGPLPSCAKRMAVARLKGISGATIYKMQEHIPNPLERPDASDDTNLVLQLRAAGSFIKV